MSSPSLIYSLIARGVTVLGEQSLKNGNFPVIARTLLDKLPSDLVQNSYNYEKFAVHVRKQHPFTFIALSDSEFDLEGAQSFLKSLSSTFMNSYAGIGETAISLSMNRILQPLLEDQMNSCNKTVEGRKEKMALIKHKIEGNKNVMMDSIDKIWSRGEKIEILVDRSQQLETQSSQFRRDTRTLNNRMWWQHKKTFAILGLGGIGVLGLFLTINCGITMRQCF